MLQFTPTTLVVFGHAVHWYGVIIAAGMALAVALAARREGRVGLPRETSLDLALWGIPAAIIGARLYYVLFSWRDYAAEPIRALYIWEGGMAVYGGILGGILAGYACARHKRLPFLKLGDLAAPSIALGQAVGRWGNFVNQEAYGAVASHEWQAFFPLCVYIQADGRWHYAAFFYESAWCLLIVFALLTAEHRRLFRRDGDLFMTYLFLYALERALVESLRTDSLVLGALRVSQLLSLAVLMTCGCVLLVRSAKKARPAGAVACCAALAALLLSDHAPAALIPAAGALVCFTAAVTDRDA